MKLLNENNIIFDFMTLLKETVENIFNKQIPVILVAVSLYF